MNDHTNTPESCLEALNTPLLTLNSLCVLVCVVCVLSGGLHGYRLLLTTILLKENVSMTVDEKKRAKVDWTERSLPLGHWTEALG